MTTSYYAFLAALLLILFASITILLLRNDVIKKKSVNWLYLLTGCLAFYCIESASYGQPFKHTFLLVIALFVIPISIGGIIDRNHHSKN